MSESRPDDSTRGDGPPLMSPEQRQQRAGVARGEVLVHSGMLDLASAAAVFLGLLLLPAVLGGQPADTLALARVLLGTAAGVYLLRALLRLGSFWNT